MARNFRLIIEYDGTDYHGWQSQLLDRSIQNEIENALSAVTGRAVRITGSGRTDAGVHALGQSANFHCDTLLSPEIFQRALNSLLPRDIVIKSCFETNAQFHSRYDAIGKIYQYRIHNTTIPSALFCRYTWHIRKLLDIEAMGKACQHILGSHDFKAFQAQGSRVKGTFRQIYRAELVRKDAEVVFEIEGSGFLRYMVRNIVGTLVEVGLGKKTPEAFNEILCSGDRSLAGATAPAKGLFLVEVKY